MPQPPAFDDEGSWPTYVRVMLRVGDQSWREHRRCQRSNAKKWEHVDPKRQDHWITDRTKSKVSIARRAAAALECTLCPVQWDCTIFAIQSEDRWSVSGAEVEDRRLIAQHPNWLELIEHARDRGMTIAELVDKLKDASLTVVR